MSYYFPVVMLFMAIAYGVQVYRENAWRLTGNGPVFWCWRACRVCINLSNLYHTYEYSKESMCGKSEPVKENSANRDGSGLERDYITQWSYGIGETFSLLVPKCEGAASVPLAANEKAMEKANPMYGSTRSRWDNIKASNRVHQTGVCGCFRDVPLHLGLVHRERPDEMGTSRAANNLFHLAFVWGKNFMGFTDLFIDYMPMYNKFRAASSILVIAELTIPLLAMPALKEVVTVPNIIKERKKDF